MTNDFMAEVEIQLDTLRMRVKALETALTSIPQINFQVDPSRPEGVVVEPAALRAE